MLSGRCLGHCDTWPRYALDKRMQNTHVLSEKEHVSPVVEIPISTYKCDDMSKKVFSDDCSYQYDVDRDLILVTTVNSGMLDFALNLNASLARNGFRILNFIAEDEHSCRTILKREPTRGMCLNAVNTGKTKSFSYQSKGYNELVSRRPSSLLELLKSNRPVLYIDADIYVLHDFSEHMYCNGTFDMAAQVDVAPNFYCTGFMLLCPTKATKQVMSDWKLSMERKPGLNQRKCASPSTG